jgi:peptide-O-fucosyltransferase
MARQGGKSDDCNAKDGNPFGPFWDNFNIDFVKSEFFTPLTYDVEFGDTVEQWNQRYEC